MKSFVLVVLLVLGLSRSIFSSKYIEDTSEDQQDEDEGTKDTGDSEDQEEPDSDEYREDNNNQDNRDTGEEVVNIPGRSEEREETEDSEDDENGEYGEDEEENSNVQDERMMDNNEGRLPLPDEVEVYTPEQTGIEGFKRRVEELNKANEDIQTTINEMKMKIDEALSSGSESNGPSDISVESKRAVPHDASNSYSSVNEAREDSTDHLKQAGAQLEAHSDDDLARQYSEIGEDANTVPDEDY